MPKLSPSYLDGATFTFRTRQEAESRERIGGSCFAVLKPVEGSETFAGRPLFIPYFITNRHVIYSGGASVVSVNRRDGGRPDILEWEPTDWTVHPKGEDVAAINAWGSLKEEYHKISPIRGDQLLTEKRMKDLDIGVGDDVFMVGRFVNHQGRDVNHPAVRFGNISMMQENIWVKRDNRSQESFAVEMRSKAGFSGAPVAVFRTGTVTERGQLMVHVNLLGILGINWGYILDEFGENTWLNGVVPAWKILEVLEVPKLVDEHKKCEEAIKLMVGKRPGDGVVQAFSGSESSDPENPTHREDFTALLNAAVKKPKSAG